MSKGTCAFTPTTSHLKANVPLSKTPSLQTIYGVSMSEIHTHPMPTGCEEECASGGRRRRRPAKLSVRGSAPV